MAAYDVRSRDRFRPGETLDIHREMMRLTLGIAGKTLFNADVEGEAEDIGRALTASLELFNWVTVPFAEQLLRLPIPPARRFRAARERLDATIYRIIAQRRSSGADTGDLLSMLLAEEEDAEGSADRGRGATDSRTGRSAADVQLRDDVLTVFLAGHETTANALTWTWYLLSQYPEVEAALHAEIDAVLAGRPPEVDDLPRLEYTRMVLAESMRLYPPAWAVGRLALEDYAVGGYVAPRGSVILLSQFLTHRDGRYFPDPRRFDPERWRPGAEAGRPKYAYFPFGAGLRLCIGEGFAWMEGVLLIATLAQRWRFRLAPGQRIEAQPLITLRPRSVAEKPPLCVT